MIRELYILRGLPGSGKSTLAGSLSSCHVEADHFFEKDGEYVFDASKLSDAHKWCQSQAESFMRNGQPRIVVSNTFTQEWEMVPYLDLAKRYGYWVFSIVVENRHGGINEHGVSDEILEKMEKRFELKLR